MATRRAGVWVAAAVLVLTSKAANAEPRRDISQLELESAQQSSTISGFQIKVLPGLSQSNGTGVFLGGQFVQFINDLFFFGGGGFGGTLVGRQGQNGGFGYGGFIAGLEARPGDKFSFDISALVGGGGGTPAPGGQASGFVVATCKRPASRDHGRVFASTRLTELERIFHRPEAGVQGIQLELAGMIPASSLDELRPPRFQDGHADPVARLIQIP
jgi:hypothetical protein